MSKMKRALVPAMTLVMLLALPAVALADLTAFWGVARDPATRSVRGFAAGLNLLIIGFEFEYAHTAEDVEEAAPGLRTGMLNGLVQTPTSGTQFYLTAGGGFFRERMGEETETGVGTNIGGGVKIGLAGPLRLRLDYRVFSLRGAPVIKNPQRFYGGVNLSF
jgi:hypothetical protein